MRVLYLHVLVINAMFDKLVHVKLGVLAESPSTRLTLLLQVLRASEMFDDHVTIERLLHVEGEVTLGAPVLDFWMFLHHV